MLQREIINVVSNNSFASSNHSVFILTLIAVESTTALMAEQCMSVVCAIHFAYRSLFDLQYASLYFPYLKLAFVLCPLPLSC
ncbi:hypothetical protein CW304_04505 [Bacillus sp. UFRGS-B20]|nr:hypothetical protein CW304_04505 [Bacillus sp. UFRGS-B20]